MGISVMIWRTSGRAGMCAYVYRQLLQDNFLMLLSRYIQTIQKLCTFQNVLDVVAVFDTGLDGLYESLVLAQVLIGNIVLGSNGLKSVASVNFELAAVGKSCAALVAQEVDEHVFLVDVLCPCTVEGDACFIGTDMTGDEVINVVGTVLDISGILSPHAGVLVGLHILSHLAVSITGQGL